MHSTSNLSDGDQRQIWTGALLSGGASRRMGLDKLELQFPDGTFLLDRPAQALRESCGTCLLVGEKNRRAPMAGQFTLVPDQTQGGGPLSALLGAMTACQTPWLLLLGGDMPLLTASHMKVFQKCAEEVPNQVLMAESSEGLEPLWSAWPSACFPYVQARWKDGERALRNAISPELLRTYHLPSEAQPPTMNQPFLNINHPEDWQRLLDAWAP